MGSRLWLDDYRKPPWGYDLWARTAADAIALLEKYGVQPRFGIEHCSLDHDLAEEHYAVPVGAPVDRSKFATKTGYAILEWMHEKGTWVTDISVHTLSEVGGADMMAALKERAPTHVQYRRVKPGEV